jgi:ral guanine nucleotide dissociation stimulator-like 1
MPFFFYLFSKQQLISHGTSPYLGTFLTDLTMVDTAIPDATADGLINFDKRRKEFEVLAQIKLLQGAANSYQIANDPRFERWFESLMVLDDREAYELSCNLEPSNSGHSSARNSEKFPRRKPNGYGHRKNDSIASTSSSSSSQFLSELDGANSANLSLGESSASLEQKMFHTHLSSSSSSSSLPSLDVSVSSSGGGTTGLSVGTHSSSQNATPSKAGSLPRGVTPPYSVSPMRTPDFYVIRVSIASPSKETEGINLYKSIMVSNHERSPQVIRNAMVKHGLEGNPEDYTLAQLLPKGGTSFTSLMQMDGWDQKLNYPFFFLFNTEMVLPSNANVYYAINTSCDLNFILRPRGESMAHHHHTPPGSGSASGRSTPTRLRMRECHKDSSAKDTLKARKKILSLGL